MGTLPPRTQWGIRQRPESCQVPEPRPLRPKRVRAQQRRRDSLAQSRHGGAGKPPLGCQGDTPRRCPEQHSARAPPASPPPAQHKRVPNDTTAATLAMQRCASTAAPSSCVIAHPHCPPYVRCTTNKNARIVADPSTQHCRVLPHPPSTARPTRAANDILHRGSAGHAPRRIASLSLIASSGARRTHLVAYISLAAACPSTQSSSEPRCIVAPSHASTSLAETAHSSPQPTTDPHQSSLSTYQEETSAVRNQWCNTSLGREKVSILTQLRSRIQPRDFSRNPSYPFRHYHCLPR